MVRKRDDERGVRRERLIRARERAGLTRTELARRLKMSRQMVYRVEEGFRRPKYATMIRWADALNATMDVFRDRDEQAAA